MSMMARRTCPISWLKAARKTFEVFPADAQTECLRALTIAAEGHAADIAKPLHGLGSGVWELTLRHRSDAYRVVYAVQIDTDLWVIHAFQKKSTIGTKTSQHEIDVVRERLKRLKEALA